LGAKNERKGEKIWCIDRAGTRAYLKESQEKNKPGTQEGGANAAGSERISRRGGGQRKTGASPNQFQGGASWGKKKAVQTRQCVRALGKKGGRQKKGGKKKSKRGSPGGAAGDIGKIKRKKFRGIVGGKDQYAETRGLEHIIVEWGLQGNQNSGEKKKSSAISPPKPESRKNQGKAPGGRSHRTSLKKKAEHHIRTNTSGERNCVVLGKQKGLKERSKRGVKNGPPPPGSSPAMEGGGQAPQEMNNRHKTAENANVNPCRGDAHPPPGGNTVKKEEGGGGKKQGKGAGVRVLSVVFAMGRRTIAFDCMTKLRRMYRPKTRKKWVGEASNKRRKR